MLYRPRGAGGPGSPGRNPGSERGLAHTDQPPAGPTGWTGPQATGANGRSPAGTCLVCRRGTQTRQAPGQRFGATSPPSLVVAERPPATGTNAGSLAFRPGTHQRWLVGWPAGTPGLLHRPVTGRRVGLGVPGC